jgi:hypothetical protein
MSEDENCMRMLPIAIIKFIFRVLNDVEILNYIFEKFKNFRFLFHAWSSHCSVDYIKHAFYSAEFNPLGSSICSFSVKLLLWKKGSSL